MRYFDNNKGQGLPINTIILIAVGLLILVLMIVFVTGGFKSFASATGGTGGSALSAFQGECNSYCSSATGSSYPTQWCTTSTPINGKLYTCPNATGSPQVCSFVLGNGSTGTWTYNAGVPGNYCKLQSMS